MATLDPEELCVVRDLFKNGDVSDDGRISVAKVLACVEEMDYIVDGPMLDFIKSVVPKAVAVDRLSLNDVVQVAAAAKTQDQQGSGVPAVPSISREDSLAELEISFNRQVRSGELTADVIEEAGEEEEETQVPSMGLVREDSLAQLKSSYRKQALAGNLPEVVVEGPEGSEHGAPPSTAVVGQDVPQRRRSITGSHPAPSPRPAGSQNGAVVGVDVPQRRRSIALSCPSPSSSPNAAPGFNPRGDSDPAIHTAEPVIVDDLPKRRSSVATPGIRSLVGLPTEGTKGIYDDDGSTMPASPEIFRQSSEEQLLGTAGSIGMEPVQESSVPKKRLSFTVSESWKEAIAQESAKALEAKKIADAQEAEKKAARERAESEKIRAEVDAYLSRLAEQVEHKSAVAQAREEAETHARAAALEVQKAEAVAARAEVETTLRLVVESLERDATVAAAKEEAELLVKKEAEAREAAETKAVEAAKRAEEALRLVAQAEEEAKAVEESSREAARVRDEEQALREEEERAREEAARLKTEEEDRVKDDARRALQAEAELLRSKLQEAGEAAAERAQEEAQAKADKEAEELKRAEEQAQREASLAEQAKRSAEREVEAREAADREAKGWEEKFNALQREREEEVQRAKEAAREELERAVQEAREFEKAKMLALQEKPEERHPLAGATVSFEDVDHREGRNWWQCVFCSPNEMDNEGATSVKTSTHSEGDASVAGMKLGSWASSSVLSTSTRSMDRPGKGDVCTVS